MIQRYHLDLAVVAAAVGIVVLVAAVRLPAVRARAVALAGAAGAVLGSMDHPRGVVWVAAALVAVLVPGDGVPNHEVPNHEVPDRERERHPLGRFTLGLTVVTLVGVWAGVPDTEPALSVGLTLAPLACWHLATGRAPGRVGTVAAVVAVLGAVWTGSAGWGAALASVGAVGLIASAPVVAGFTRPARGTGLGVLVTLQIVVGLGLPRLVMDRPVGAAVGIAVAANAALLAAFMVIEHAAPGGTVAGVVDDPRG